MQKYSEDTKHLAQVIARVLQKEAFKISPKSIVAGVGAGVGLATLPKIWQRLLWGDLVNQKMGPERAKDELTKEYQKRLRAREDAMEAYRNQWKEDETGGFYNPETGALTGRKAFMARMGRMQEAAKAEEAKWLRDRIRKQTRTGTLLSSSKPSAMDEDFAEWQRKKYQADALSPVFMHRGKIFSRDTGLMSAITGKKPSMTGDRVADTERDRQEYQEAVQSLYT